MELAKRLASAIWNGPFYIGKLTRPISLGEVALKLLETLWRLGVVVTALTFAIIAYVASEDMVPKPKQLFEQIEATASWGDGCEGDMPVSVTLRNNSKEKVGRVDFTLAAFEPQRTTNLVSVLGRDYTSDIVIPAGQTSSLCFVAPEFSDAAVGKEPRRLRYVVEVKNAEATLLD